MPRRKKYSDNFSINSNLVTLAVGLGLKAPAYPFSSPSCCFVGLVYAGMSTLKQIFFPLVYYCIHALGIWLAICQRSRIQDFKLSRLRVRIGTTSTRSEARSRRIQFVQHLQNVVSPNIFLPPSRIVYDGRSFPTHLVDPSLESDDKVPHQ